MGARVATGTFKVTLDPQEPMVAGSGHGELVGIPGELELTMADGGHSYALTYTLPDA